MGASTKEDGHGPECRRARRSLVVVDLVESVRLMQEHEDDVIDRWRRFVHEVRDDLLPAHGGRLVKSLGDGMLLDFDTARQAVAASLALQHLISKYNDDREPAAGLALRVGVHESEVVVDELDVYGRGVNLAARLATAGGPGEVVASVEVRDQITPHLDAEVEDLGPVFLKHLDRPVPAFRLSAADRRAAAPAPQRRDDDLRTAIAVVPFSVARGPVALGDLVADGLIAALSASRDLRIVSRLSTAALRDRPDALSLAGSHLGAHYVLHGSVAGDDREAVLALELAEVATGTVMWSTQAFARWNELLAGDTGFWTDLAAAARSVICDTELRRSRVRPLPSVSSYALQLSAVTLMHRSTREDFQRGHELLRHLGERHARHPAPHAWMAKWYVLKWTRGWGEGEADTLRALDETRRALDTDPDCALALAVDGFVQCHLLHRLDEAERRLDRAIESDPHEALAWLFKGVTHAFRGEGERALPCAERALALSPLDPMRYYHLSLAATAAVAAGAYERAIALAQSSLALHRSHSSTYRALAIAQSLHGQVDAARATVDQLLTLEPGFTVQSFLRRSPSADYDAGMRYAEALRQAGLPEGA